MELHNHTIESDGELQVEELLEYAVTNNFQTMAITDHNTCAPYHKAMSLLHDKPSLTILPGVEVSTFYGHILALGLSRMIDWRKLNPHRPEEFFEFLRESGARVVGAAHPFCIGEPITVGCRFNLQVKDWSTLDYIEVFNTSAPELFIGNRQALVFWEQLVLDGVHIAALTGKDMHSLPKSEDVFTTYAIFNDGTVIDDEAFYSAILEQRTLVTKGPLFSCHAKNGGLVLSPHRGSEASLLAECRHSGGVQVSKWDLNNELFFPLAENAGGHIIKLYKDSVEFENLMAVRAWSSLHYL